MKRRIVITILLLIGIVAATQAETVHLKDGSTLKGHVLSITSDSLYVKTSFGARVAIPRSSVASIIFAGGVDPSAMPPESGPAGEGRLAITFSSRSLSSKIRIRKKDDKQALLQANWIVQSLFVDGNEAFSYIDSLMDKTIYKGPERIYKNMIEIEDIDVVLPAGTYDCVVVVESYGGAEYGDRFDGKPLSVSIAFDNVRIDPGRTTRHRVGLERGFLRRKAPQFKNEGN